MLRLILVVSVTLLILVSTKVSTISGASSHLEIQIAVGLNRSKVSGGETATGRVEVRRNGNTQELVFRLEANSPLVRLNTTEVRLKPDQSSASFEIFTSATPIRTSVVVKALLQPADQLQAQRTLEIVPAILKSVSLTESTLRGTHGAKISVRAELNAAAPTGGIELYLEFFCSTIPGKLLTLQRPDPRIPSGSRELTFDIEYDRLFSGDDRISDGRTGFDTVTRTIELVVSLEAQSTKPWQAIPGVAKKLSFDVVPLRVTSISVQPSAVSGGGESLASLALNIPPGTNEALRLVPIGTQTSGKAWARLLGTSCQSPEQEPLLLQLTPGVTSYNFKVCTASVTALTTGTLRVTARSGSFPVSITVQP